MSVEVVVADPESHTSLLAAVLIECHAGFHGGFSESAVVVVAEEKARRRVARGVDVRPAVVVEVESNDGHHIAGAGLRKAGGCRDIGKSPVAIVPVQRD